MKAFFATLFALFLSPAGLFALAALDSSMVFFLPAAVDIAVIRLVVRNHNLFWAFPLIATAGSMLGAYITFRVGEKIGENSLDCWVPAGRLKSIESKIKDKGAIALAMPGMMPPPFPLTPFVLACGAFNVRAKTFFTALAAARLFRYSVITGLALIYGRHIITILESPIFKTVVAVFIVVALIGTAYSGYRVVQSTKTGRLKNQKADHAR